eukprot:TRINITY_DN722_c0_g1_i1.p1 TRINITY_DN722_c0_g1~~TRINITY_DN722_c0_g1_i1.p1  ORF type:complete len:336 (-),score=69.24 TRINITY_DN722_c0_g1_i1:41-1048(-)
MSGEVKEFRNKALNKGCFEEVYEVKEQIGKGNFSIVKSARHKQDGGIRAVKFIDLPAVNPNAELKNMVDNEIDALATVQHPNIITLYEYFVTPTQHLLVLELLTGGEMFDKIVELEKYSERDASRLAGQFLGALAAIHKVGFIHRDLKPENLLLSSKDLNASVKIADFGFSKYLGDDGVAFETCGSPMYTSPEVVAIMKAKSRGHPIVGYTYKSDVWAAGVILYIMLCGFPPFYDEDLRTLYDTIQNGELEFPLPEWDNISQQAKDLITKMLNTDPAKRLSSAEVLQHPWVSAQSSVPESHLGHTTSQLRSFNAKRKFRSAVHGVMALNKFRLKY